MEARGGLKKISAEQLAELKAKTPFRGLELELGALKEDVAANAVHITPSHFTPFTAGTL